MTFMDECHASAETEAKKACAILQIWCATISPLDSFKNSMIRSIIAHIASDMQWETKFNDDLHIQEIVLGEENATTK